MLILLKVNYNFLPINAQLTLPNVLPQTSKVPKRLLNTPRNRDKTTHINPDREFPLNSHRPSNPPKNLFSLTPSLPLSFSALSRSSSALTLSLDAHTMHIMNRRRPRLV